MSDPDLTADLALAADLVRDAGGLAATMLEQGLETHYKTSVSDVVSAADHAAEDLVVGRLTAARPDDGLVGEEGHARPGARTWFIDPVDGTYNFLSGLPYWCSALGLVDDEGPALGAVYYPARDELWLGHRGRATTLNGRPVPTLADTALSEISVATYIHPARMGDLAQQQAWSAVVRQAATVRMLGSASVDLSGVATGRVGLFLQADLNDWDWVPGAALVLSAGGTTALVEHGGHRWQIAGNAQAVAEAEAAIRAS